jgi:hypothetical protein
MCRSHIHAILLLVLAATYSSAKPVVAPELLSHAKHLCLACTQLVVQYVKFRNYVFMCLMLLKAGILLLC